jgi:hypothetical protein
MKNKQNGFTLVEGLLVVIALTLVSFAGWYVWNTNQNEKKAESNNSSSSTEAPKAESEADPTSGWKEYTNVEGKFSLKYPSNWVTASNPELCSEGIFLLGPTAETVGKCGSDSMGQMLFNSFMVESGPMGLTEEYYDGIESKEVTVNGVKGERQSGVYSYEGDGIGPAKGTKSVVYIFKSNGLIYKATYEQQPGFPDVEKDFDLIVTKTLRFN